MYSLVNSNFNRKYNPSGRQNALSDIKRLLTSRDTAAQNKACGYLIEVINRCNRNSDEGVNRMVQYLLDNDITVFLCEATTNLDFSLFRSITSCMRLLWRSPRFFTCEHGAQAAGAVLRALAHYAHSGDCAAVTACLRFLWDLLNGISAMKATPPLSHQSEYSTVQLLACLHSLAQAQIHANAGIVLAGGMLLEALIGYQPEGVYINSSTAKALVPVLSAWVPLVLGALQHAALTDCGAPGGTGDMGPLYVVACLIGIHSLGLMKLFHHGDKKVDFVQAILADDQDENALKQCSAELSTAVRRVVSELVAFTKEHESHIPTEEYAVFLQLLLTCFQQSQKDVTLDLCESLFSRGYLTMLPQVQIVRNDLAIRQVSTLVLAELLKVLADNFLKVDDAAGNCADDIHLGLVDLQNGIEKPQALGVHLQKGQPYSLLVYIYFYCQSSDNPEEATGPLLPYLVEHILKLARSVRPPPYIIKALWLVFAMSTISNDSMTSLEERIRVEKASERLVSLLLPEPGRFYSHNPALLLWAFASHRINYFVKFQVVSEWLKLESSIPAEFTTDPSVRELLLNVLIHSQHSTILEHCTESLHMCVDGDDNDRKEFTHLVWNVLPDVLSKALIDDGQLAPNVCYVLELASSLLPPELDPSLSLKAALLIMTTFSKSCTGPDCQSKRHFQYVCLKLCLHLLKLASNQNDYGVLITCVNRAGFLASVLAASSSLDDKVACAALQLLSYVAHHFTRRNYQPKAVVQVQTSLIIPSLRRECHSERGACLLQLLYIILNSGANSPLALACEPGELPPAPERQGAALRCLLFRIQQMLCSRSSTGADQTTAGWKTLSAIFKHALVTKNDSKLVASLTSQPWTFILVQFHISQPTTAEFLIFLQNWLTLLKIALENYQEGKQLSQYSLVTRTMVMLRKKLKGEEEQKEPVQTIHGIAREILLGSSAEAKF